MTNSPSRRLGARLLLALAALPCCATQAIAQSDPTRPPAAFLAADPKQPEVAKEGAAPVEAPPAAAQIVLSSGSRKSFAVVDGKVVRVGETVNGSRLVEITEAGPVWERGGAREQSSMTPGIDRTQAVATSAAAPATLAPAAAPVEAPAVIGREAPPRSRKKPTRTENGEVR